MKILLVSGKLSYSNPTVFTLELVAGLKSRGHDVEIAIHGGALAEKLRELGVEVYQIKHNYLSFRRMLQFIRDFAPDVIHATGGPQALAAAGRIAQNVVVPYIHTVHSWLPEDQQEPRPEALSGIVVINQSLREHLVNDANVPKSKIRVIPYGVDADELQLRGPQGQGQIPVVGTIGRLTRGRRHEDFIRAAALVREANEDVHFVVAGDGKDEARLRKMVRELKLADVVTFVQPSSSIEIFSVIDLLVIISDWGGVGLNILEAMAQGIPVIATGGGEVFSILGREDMCQVVPREDDRQLADEILKLLAAPGRRRELAENAYKHVLVNYPLEEQILALEEYYEAIVSD